MAGKHNKLLLFLLLVSHRHVFAVAAQEGANEKKEDPSLLQVYWRDGIRIRSRDNKFEFRVGARLHQDWAFMSADPRVVSTLGDLTDAVEFRRARLELGGTLYSNVDFRFQVEFGGGDVDFKDVYIALTGLPGLGEIRAGHFKEPFSLEEITSSNDIPFMERSLPNAFAPSRNAGLMAGRAVLGGRMTWAAGAFVETDDSGFAVTEGNWNITGRVTGLPWYRDSGRHMMHMGLSYSHRDPLNDVRRFRQRPEAHLAPRFVDSGNFALDAEDRLAVEGALVHGPLWAQAEYFPVFLDRPTGPDTHLNSFYVQGGAFLTGENRNYRTSSGAFGNVVPRRNMLGEDGGWGAWEVLARYSKIKLNAADLSGGKLRNVTLGLNWYLNPHVRVMWNFIRTERPDLGNASIFQMRFQVNF